jgi:hypothetical protein
LVVDVIGWMTETSSTSLKGDFNVRLGACYLIQCHLTQNQPAQDAIMTELTAASGVSAGQMLLMALLDWDGSRKDPFRCWFASVVLCHVLDGSDACKTLALAHSVSDKDGAYVAVMNLI